MMQNVLVKLSIFFFIISLLSSCKSSQTTVNKKDVEVNSYEVTNVFLDSKRKLMQGNRTSAIEGFQKCIAKNSNHDASYYELARIYEHQNPNKSIEYINKAIEIDESNVWYKEFIIGIYKDHKKYEQAIIVNNDLIALEPDNKNYYYQRANLFIYNNDNKNALKTYNEILKKFGYEEGVLSQKKQIYLSEREYKKAMEVIEELIIHNPENKDYYGMLAELYLNQGKTEEAMDNYKKILEIDPTDGFVHFALADYYYSKGEKDRAQKELEVGMVSDNLDINRKMQLLIKVKELAADDIEMRANFDALLKIATKKHPYDPRILALNADYYNAQGKTLVAIDYFKRIIAIDSSKYVIWNELLLAESNIDDSQALLNHSNRALKLFPQHSNLYLYNALANAKYGNWREVKEKAKIGSNFAYKKEEKALLYSLRAKAEMHLGEIDNGIANYKSAMKMDVNNTDIVRDYAYYLAVNNRNTSEAVAKAKSALELNGNNPNYIHVYSYCLFRDGQKELALKWLKPSLVKFPDNKKLQLLDMEINKNE